MNEIESILQRVEALATEKDRAGMLRYKVCTERAFGVSMVNLRKVAKDLGRDHGRALKLWKSGWFEGRILCILTADPAKITRDLMEKWAGDFDSWALVDAACMHYFRLSPLAWDTALEWVERDEEFVKRAGFTLLATLAVHEKQWPSARFLALFPVLEKGAQDDRNFVKKAVNWALRQIGKRDPEMSQAALEFALQLKQSSSKSARWVGTDAARELQGKLTKRPQRRRANSAM